MRLHRTKYPRKRIAGKPLTKRGSMPGVKNSAGTKFALKILKAKYSKQKALELLGLREPVTEEVSANSQLS